MKKVLMFLCVIAIAAISCKKEGPQGPAGPTGPNGKDATINCQQCHNQTTILAAVDQYEESVHGAGERSFETGTSCAGCHTNEGFNECILTGSDNTAATIQNATPISCYTCHNIHKNYDISDLSLKVTAPVKLRGTTSVNTTLPDFGEGNLCAKCHQPRVLTTSSAANPSTGKVLDNTTNDNDSIYIKSSRFGSHHGPQSTVLAGVGYGAFEISGSQSYSNGHHGTITNACITCHMASSSSGKFIGGHTWKVIGDVDGTETLDINGCGATDCHAGKTAADMTTKINTTQAATQALLDQIQAALVAKGWFSTTTGLFTGTSTKPLKMKAKQAKACYNFDFITQDRSLGVHNADYTKALLQNSLDALK